MKMLQSIEQSQISDFFGIIPPDSLSCLMIYLCVLVVFTDGNRCHHTGQRQLRRKLAPQWLQVYLFTVAARLKPPSKY